MKKVLVVEDEPEVRKTIVELLINAGYTVTQAADGQYALESIQKDIPDLVISDVMMPRVDGFKVLEEVRKVPAVQSIPFIFLSAKTEYADLRKGMNNGAEDYLFKPFRVKELLLAVESQFRKKEKIEESFDKICMNISSSIPHELLTPIIPMLGYPDVLSDYLEKYTKDEIEQMLNQIKESGHRLHKTVRKFLGFLDIKMRLINKKENQVIEEGLSCSVRDTVEMNCVRNIIKENRKDDLTIDVEEAEVIISKEDFEIVIDEMVSNAVKFSKPGENISVKGKIFEDRYLLEITDQGRGMTPEQLNIIVPFLQHQKTKYEQSGLGLGLSIIKKTMEYYGGYLKLTSNPYSGTTCSIFLTLRKANN